MTVPGSMMRASPCFLACSLITMRVITCTEDDARTWLSGVLANHRSCLDGLDHHEKAGFIDQADHHDHVVAKNLTTLLISEALAKLYVISQSICTGRTGGKWLASY